MRLAWIVPGGMDRSLRERVIPALLWQVERLSARHDVHVISLTGDAAGARYTLLGATVHVLQDGTRRAGARQLVGALRAAGPFDVIHAFWAGRAALVASIAGRILGTPVVLSLCGGELVALRDIRYGGALTWHGRATVRLVLRLADRVTAASEPMRALARPLRPDVERIPLGVDLGRFGPATDRAAPQSGPPWRLLHVGSINAVKDQATLLRAFRRIADEVPDVSLDLVGEDTLGGTVHRLASSLGLDGMVRFHGFMPSEAVAGLCREAHLFMLTSRHEAGPVAVLESAACCVPTVGTIVGHVSEWAPDLALSRPIGEADGLAQAAVTLLRDPSRRNRMGESARAWVERHDADWTSSQFESLYRQVRRT